MKIRPLKIECTFICAKNYIQRKNASQNNSKIKRNDILTRNRLFSIQYDSSELMDYFTTFNSEILNEKNRTFISENMIQIVDKLIDSDISKKFEFLYYMNTNRLHWIHEESCIYFLDHLTQIVNKNIILLHNVLYMVIEAIEDECLFQQILMNGTMEYLIATFCEFMDHFESLKENENLEKCFIAVLNLFDHFIFNSQNDQEIETLIMRTSFLDIIKFSIEKYDETNEICSYNVIHICHNISITHIYLILEDFEIMQWLSKQLHSTNQVQQENAFNLFIGLISIKPSIFPQYYTIISQLANSFLMAIETMRSYLDMIGIVSESQELPLIFIQFIDSIQKNHPDESVRHLASIALQKEWT
jgi:hypothetical protein